MGILRSLARGPPMLIVQKYGGTSVGDVDRIRNVVGRIARTRNAGHQVVAVVSAMAGETNRLLALAKAAAGRPSERETDALIACGEIANALMIAGLKRWELLASR